MATMAEAIQQGLDDWHKARLPGKALVDHIAAAVAAHMLEPATIERILEVLVREMEDAGLELDHLQDAVARPLNSDRDDVLTVIRTAIRAALGEHEGVGRG